MKGAAARPGASPPLCEERAESRRPSDDLWWAEVSLRADAHWLGPAAPGQGLCVRMTPAGCIPTGPGALPPAPTTHSVLTAPSHHGMAPLGTSQGRHRGQPGAAPALPPLWAFPQCPHRARTPAPTRDMEGNRGKQRGDGGMGGRWNGGVGGDGGTGGPR